MGDSRRSRKRSRAEVLSPVSAAGGGERWLAGVLTFSILGMGVMFGGTSFWASAPFFMMALAVAACCHVLALRAAARGDIHLSPPPGVWLWTGLCAIVLVRALFAPRIPFQAWTELIQLAAGLLIYVAVSDLCNRRGVWKWVLGAYLIFVCLQGMYGLWLHTHGRNDVLWLSRPAGYGMRASGTFICPNHYANVLQLGVVLAVGLLLMPAAGLPLRLLAGYSLLPALPALVLSLSRAGVLGTLVGLFTLAVVLALRGNWKRVLAVFALVMAFLSGLGYIAWRFLPAVQERVRHTMAGDVRFSQYYPDTWRMILGEGFWGAGPGTFRHVFDQYRQHFADASVYIHYAHSEPLHFLAEYGVLTFLAVSAGLIAIGLRWLIAALRAESHGHAILPALMLALFCAALSHAAFDFNLHIPGAALALVLLLGCLDGRGLQLAVWRRTPIPAAFSRRLPWIALSASLILLAAFVPLFFGSLAERRLEQAIARNDSRAADATAASLRRWLPIHSRGWTELGYQHRAEAFWLREPAARAAAIAASRAAYTTALRWNPLDRLALAGLVELDKLDDDDAAAARGLERLIRLSPFDARIRIQYGLALIRLGRLEEAREQFLAADRMRPGSRQVRLNLERIDQLLHQRATSP